MEDLESQFNISREAYDGAMKATTALHEITVLREQLEARAGTPPVAGAAEGLETKLEAIAGDGGGRGGRGAGGGGRAGGGAAGPGNLTALRLQLARVVHTFQAADQKPTTAQTEFYLAMAGPLNDLLDQWAELKATDIKALNETLERENLPLLSLDTTSIDHDVEDQIEMGDDE